MYQPVVSGGAVVSKVLLVGQAPGDKEPKLVIPVGRLAIAQFLPLQKLDQIIGRTFAMTGVGYRFDVIALPHPSGASPWHRKEPGKSLLKKALRLIVKHPAFNFQNKGVDYGLPT
jgi:uracil-DNA glycosylase